MKACSCVQCEMTNGKRIFLCSLTEKSDQLFDEADDDSDGDLFGHKTGGLFEDEISKVTSQPAAKSKGDDDDTDLFGQKGKKGQSLFDETDEEEEETPAKQPVSQPKPTTSSKPMFGGSSGGGLFDDDSDIGSDVLTTATTSKVKQKDTTTASSGKPTASSLFDDEGDLFGDSPPPPPEVGGQKKPVGGVSLFGDQSSAVVDAVVKRVSCVSTSLLQSHVSVYEYKLAIS